ncbi:outer membrane beta-barrel family protein [Flavihumibacter petaseus]|uniref:Putative TonB-dependent receptor n=1 Tax=Flavihumibacter petaseus NBRC 106054 TaxID=1220578 RepID=A0A0E9N0N9_9BACT|nr:outer membrane beta-barrel family protein [Flavihumibacter petaseus]GAO43394.1 putative TonB-dependent receptor [Flavihumibacter petaseus NBRC 106054]
MLLCCGLIPAVSAQSSLTDPIKIYGKVIDQKTGKALEAATITLTAPNGTDSVSGHSVTDKDGNFSITIAKTTRIKIEISAVGFEKQLERISLDETDKEYNAGKFLMITDAANLAGVVVTAKKPAMTLAVDRRIFSADAAVTAKGGNAVDVMKNIPSLSVDVNGGVQLRNSTPQILVDGRPTILTLEQIPADDIDKVEVITNPSSKYDAGSTGGIINIIMKKNRKAGLNGIASVGAGTPELLNGSLSLNYRKNKFNFFASGNYNRSGGVAKGEAYRENKSAGVITDYFNQNSETDRLRRFASVRFGADYFIDKYNTISLTQGFVSGKFDNTEKQDQFYYDKDGALTSTGYRLSTDNDWFNRANTQLNYRRTYDKSGKEWTADFTYSGGHNGGDGIIGNQLYKPNGDPLSPIDNVNSYGKGSGNQLTFQTDYVNPLTEKSKLEFGARSFYNVSLDKLDVYSMSPSGDGVKLPLSNNYRFREMVNAVYANYSNTIGNLKYQGGLRIEQSTFKGELLDSLQKFGYDYPSGGNNLWNTLFPSLFLTYELGNGNDLQANFTRRINRPNFWQINPYVDISDPMNIRRGNPELQPEFTNSFELNYNKQYSSGNFLLSTYYRNNTADITMYSDTLSQKDIEDLNNASIDPNALLTTFINADRTNRMGVEMTLQQRFGKNFDITPNINGQYRDVKATVNDVNLSNYGFNWSAKLMANYRVVTPTAPLVNNISFQLSGQYESSRVTPQGKQLEQYGIDFAIRKDFLKNKAGSLVFNVNDVLNSRRFGSITDTESFYQDSYRRWNVRTFRLTFSYRFGSSDLDLFKRRENGGGGGGDEDRG